MIVAEIEPHYYWRDSEWWWDLAPAEASNTPNPRQLTQHTRPNGQSQSSTGRSLLLLSYDTTVCYATKRTMAWTGFEVHITETCDDERPNLVTDVETTSAPVADDAVTASIHASLTEPSQHIADTGFVNSELLVSTLRDHDINLIGPARSDNGWQSKLGAGHAAADFTIDWEPQRATCAMGKTSISWTPAIDNAKNQVIKIKFGTTDWRPRPSRSLFTDLPAQSTSPMNPEQPQEPPDRA